MQAPSVLFHSLNLPPMFAVRFPVHVSKPSGARLDTARQPTASGNLIQDQQTAEITVFLAVLSAVGVCRH